MPVIGAATTTQRATPAHRDTAVSHFSKSARQFELAVQAGVEGLRTRHLSVRQASDAFSAALDRLDGDGVDAVGLVHLHNAMCTLATEVARLRADTARVMAADHERHHASIALEARLSELRLVAEAGGDDQPDLVFGSAG